ncbi:MAG: ankyrin repeat domain-containing protein [Dysgonomonas sp.]|nr:ankyrin repeat domain-containing protein [Dysgonomonas sp.]
MIKLKDIGNFKSVPQLVEDIIYGNIERLDEAFDAGWDINKEIRISKYTSELPIDYALIMGNFASVKWLVSHNVKLNRKDKYSFLTAVRYCDEAIVRYLVDNGAEINGLNCVGYDAFQQALACRNFDIFPLIHELGHSVEKYGGPVFRALVWDLAKKDGKLIFEDGKVVLSDPSTRNYGLLDFFIDNGVNINYNKPDTVFSDSETPLCVAARYVDLHMVKYLIERGADITIKTKNGLRPYSIAVEIGDSEMAAYLKALEPEDFHTLENKLDQLKSYKLPKDLIKFLQRDSLHLELGDEFDITFIDFFPLIDTVEMKVGRQKLLRISRSMSDYDHIFICWNPKAKQIACYDMEHEELANMCTFPEFIQKPGEYIQKIIDGEYM